MVALQELFSHHSNLFEASFEQKRVDVAHRLDERISHFYGLCSKSKILPQPEQQPASGKSRHAISNTSSLTATTRTPSLQMSHSARCLGQFGNQSNYTTCGASHDSLRLCGSALLDAPSTQTGRDILRPCGSMCWLSTPRTEVDSDILFSSGSIPPSNTLRQQVQPYGADTNHSLLGHGVETIYQIEKSTVGGKHRTDLDSHIRKIHKIERQGSSLSETSTTDSPQAHDTPSIHLESYDCGHVPAVNLDSSRSIKLNHSIFASQSPPNVSEHPYSALSRVQKEGTKAHGVDVTQLLCNLREELEAERLEVEALRSEVLAARHDLDHEREQASLREQEFTHEVGVLKVERELMQANCADCKNYQLKIRDLETTLAEATRVHKLAMDDCAELANLKLQLAHEMEQRTLQERACDAANAAKEEYVLKFEKLNREHQKQQFSLVELKKINVALELQGASSTEVDKQRQDMCDHQSTLLRKLEAELEQVKRDLAVEREGVVQLRLQIQKLQLEVKREKERSSSHDIQLRDALEEVKQQKDTSTTTSFPFPHAEICQQTGSVFRKFKSSLDQAGLKVSQRKTKLQQAARTCDGLETKQDDKHNFVLDLRPKMDAQAQKKISEEHAYLKQVEVMLAKAVEDIKHKNLQAVEDPTGASHHASNANQAKRLVGVLSSPECLGKESALQIDSSYNSSCSGLRHYFTQESYFG